MAFSFSFQFPQSSALCLGGHWRRRYCSRAGSNWWAPHPECPPPEQSSLFTPLLSHSVSLLLAHRWFRPYSSSSRGSLISKVLSLRSPSPLSLSLSRAACRGCWALPRVPLAVLRDYFCARQASFAVVILALARQNIS